MKKLIYFIPILLFISEGYSQISIKTGVNVPNFNIKNTYENKSIDVVENNNVGYYIGVNYEYFVKDNLSVDVDILFSHISYDYELGPIKGDETFSYLSLPISINYYPIDKFKVGAGFNINNNIKSKFTTQDSEISGPIPETPSIGYSKETETTSNYNKINYSIHATVSYSIIADLSVNARFNYGLGKLDNEGKNASYESSYNNLQIGLAYKF